MSNHPDEKRRLIWDRANLAILLLEVGTSNLQELLELIFDMWVDKMLYAGTRCNWEITRKAAQPWWWANYHIMDCDRTRRPISHWRIHWWNKVFIGSSSSSEKNPKKRKPKGKARQPEEKWPQEKKIEDDRWPYYPPPTSGQHKKIEEDDDEKEEEPFTKKGKPTPPPKQESKPEFEPLRNRRFATLYPLYWCQTRIR